MLHSKPFVGFSSANKCPVKRLRSASLSDHDASSVSVEAEKRQSAALDSPKREIQKSLKTCRLFAKKLLALAKERSPERSSGTTCHRHEHGLQTLGNSNNNNKKKKNAFEKLGI